MSSKVLIVLIAVVLAGAGFFYMQSQKATNTPNEMPLAGQETAAPTLAGTSGASNSAQTATDKEFIVTGSNFKFQPTELTVNKGDTVKIIFKNTEGFHDFVIDEFNVATKKIQSGSEETVQFVADKTGSFEYYCSVGNHRAMGMKGVLTVR